MAVATDSSVGWGMHDAAFKQSTAKCLIFRGELCELFCQLVVSGNRGGKFSAEGFECRG